MITSFPLVTVSHSESYWPSPAFALVFLLILLNWFLFSCSKPYLLQEAFPDSPPEHTVSDLSVQAGGVWEITLSIVILQVAEAQRGKEACRSLGWVTLCFPIPHPHAPASKHVIQVQQHRLPTTRPWSSQLPSDSLKLTLMMSIGISRGGALCWNMPPAVLQEGTA